MDAIILDLGDEIKGECMLEGYTDKIEIMSFSHNVAMAVTNDISNTERTSGKAHLGEMSVTKFVDLSTPVLNSYCCTGKSIAEATLTIGRNSAQDDGKILPYMVYKLTNVIFSNISVSGGSGGKPVETLSLNFTKIEWQLTGQDSTGAKKGSASSSWDIATNKGDKSKQG